jgi:hypothetical protein
LISPLFKKKGWAGFWILQGQYYVLTEHSCWHWLLMKSPHPLSCAPLNLWIFATMKLTRSFCCALCYHEGITRKRACMRRKPTQYNTNDKKLLAILERVLVSLGTPLYNNFLQQTSCKEDRHNGGNQSINLAGLFWIASLILKRPWSTIHLPNHYFSIYYVLCIILSRELKNFQFM